MIRLHGRWTDPGRPSGKSFYGAKIVDDGGAQGKVEILASLVASRGILPGHQVIATGRLAVRSTNYGLEVRLVATDIQLGDQEQAAKTEVAQQGRMTIERQQLVQALDDALFAPAQLRPNGGKGALIQRKTAVQVVDQ